MNYPDLRRPISRQELEDHFTLGTDDIELLKRIRKDSTRLGFAVFLKAYQFLGYPPSQASQVSSIVVQRIAEQLGTDRTLMRQYPWGGRLWRHHLTLARNHLGFRRRDGKGHADLICWLVGQAKESTSPGDLLSAAIRRFRDQRVDLPAKKELRRLVRSARRRFFQDLYRQGLGQMDVDTLARMERCIAHADSGQTLYDWMKAPPGKLGKKTILEEIRKLEFIREFRIDASLCFPGISPQVLRRLQANARSENVWEMNRHPLSRRVTLLAALLVVREMEVTDHIVRIFLDLIRRIDKKADRKLEKELLRDIRMVYSKTQILYRVARAATSKPDGTFRQDLFPYVSEEVFHRLAQEADRAETQYDVVKAHELQRKYRRFYRQMMKPVLDVLKFRSNNATQRPLLNGLEVVHRYLHTKHTYYPDGEVIPDELLTNHWRDLVCEEGPQGGGPRIVKHFFELCVLTKLERALKCKEVWVEGAYRYRNPDEDLPANWDQNRVEHYRSRGIPLKVGTFLGPIRAEMESALEGFHRFLGRQRDVYIHHPGGGEAGVFHVPRIQAVPARPILEEIKSRVVNRWGILNLLDVLTETDRQIHFSRFFQTSAQRQILGTKEVRRRLLLALFSLGTNLGLRRIHSAARPTCSYDDLLYFRRRFVNVQALREALIALSNRILEIRNPQIWGQGTACASDGKHIGSWDQNLIAEWNPHYGKPGVMAYWHVETNAMCIYSQLKPCNSSEVAPMIEGLVRHDTEMRVESNFVDSHGQSEVAFAFCRFLGFELLPRLKRIKYEHLYAPDKGMAKRFPRLSGVFASRPIRWERIEQQYDEMVRHVVAVGEGTGPTESILRRFNRYNRTNPTYKGFIELGKALKTIFLCQYLTDPDLRREIHQGLNIIESWNSCIEFIFFGRRTQLQTNDPEMQELAILCLHLLQNALILVNTLMVERVLNDYGLLDRMESDDFRALTPLFTSNVNPYGDFTLDLDKPSFLEVA